MGYYGGGLKGGPLSGLGEPPSLVLPAGGRIGHIGLSGGRRIKTWEKE